MNSRKLVLVMAAAILREIGHEDLADCVSHVDVPLIDGRSILHVGERHGGKIIADAPGHQVVRVPPNGRVLVDATDFYPQEQA